MAWTPRSAGRLKGACWLCASTDVGGGDPDRSCAYNVCSSMSRPKKRGECVYCGAIGRVTRDHIPPRSLFGSMPPGGLLTVPSCRRCNLSASKDDEYFRLRLALKDEFGAEPDVRVILPSVMRSLQRPSATGLRNELLSGFHEREVLTPAGIYVGTASTYYVDLSRLNAVVRRIVVGLFYHHNQRRVPNGYRVNAWATEGMGLIDPANANLLTENLKALMNTPAHGIGRVITWWVAFSDADPNTSLWLLVFYRRMPFVAMTLPADALRD